MKTTKNKIKDKTELYRLIVESLFPQELVQNFDLVHVEVKDNTIDTFFDEKRICPEDYQPDELTPNGYTEPSVIQDFPIQGKNVTLHVRRCRWTRKSDKKNIVKSWNLTAKGTHYSVAFAAFLKGMLGYAPSDGQIA